MIIEYDYPHCWVDTLDKILVFDEKVIGTPIDIIDYYHLSVEVVKSDRDIDREWVKTLKEYANDLEKEIREKDLYTHNCLIVVSDTPMGGYIFKEVEID